MRLPEIPSPACSFLDCRAREKGMDVRHDDVDFRGECRSPIIPEIRCRDGKIVFEGGEVRFYIGEDFAKCFDGKVFSEEDLITNDDALEGIYAVPGEDVVHGIHTSVVCCVVIAEPDAEPDFHICKS